MKVIDNRTTGNTISVKALCYYCNGEYQDSPVMVVEQLFSTQFTTDELLVKIAIKSTLEWKSSDYKLDIRSIIIDSFDI